MKPLVRLKLSGLSERFDAFWIVAEVRSLTGVGSEVGLKLTSNVTCVPGYFVNASFCQPTTLLA